MKTKRFEGPFDTRSSEWIGDFTVWARQNAGDNSERLDRLRRSLRQAREQELTPRQRQMLTLYYDQGMNIPQIAGELGLNRSTVSRTIHVPIPYPSCFVERRRSFSHTGSCSQLLSTVMAICPSLHIPRTRTNAANRLTS